ncbi:MAG: Cell division integral membrane protein, YggT and half-length relatives [uncultured Rubrobacteraceae bacterium]|uniref:Cell division integral membrane protein, YggT and half-length relatives n=1 Tax=uncultured Rubrobacteraceae bacterium TaxID=349277 RepID=A0A6J4RVZ6_9ACTN|nr:MAG: Cell division integral membrane protein, YggT and half-length relatives [uncultured Rubrobacteraceae bacterium]
MFLLQQFGYDVVRLLTSLVDYAFYILFGFIIASILFSWFPGYPSSSFMQAIYDAVRAVANPILMPIRSRVPMLQLGGFGIDLSPIIAIFGLSIARTLLKLIIENFIGPVVG